MSKCYNSDSPYFITLCCTFWHVLAVHVHMCLEARVNIWCSPQWISIVFFDRVLELSDSARSAVSEPQRFSVFTSSVLGLQGNIMMPDILCGRQGADPASTLPKEPSPAYILIKFDFQQYCIEQVYIQVGIFKQHVLMTVSVTFGTYAMVVCDC